jgi:hypothetical protein
MSTQSTNCGSRNSIFASLEEAEYRMLNVEGLVANEPAAVWLVRGPAEVAKVPSWREVILEQGHSSGIPLR